MIFCFKLASNSVIYLVDEGAAKSLQENQKKVFEKDIFYFYLCVRFSKHKTDDSVAQLVEHIPFKDGVLSSNLS